MVARENTETAGIIRNRLVKTKLGGKIGDRIFNCAPRSSPSVSVVSSQIFLEFLKNLLQIAQERFVLREVLQTRLPRKLQHADRVVISPVPQLDIEMPKNPARSRLPCPPKIKAHLAQRLERRRQNRGHAVGLESRHANAAAK